MTSPFLNTLMGRASQRPPVWYMRQAGRVLPSYRALRQAYSFQQLMHNPELAARVTLLPVSDLGVDAAILFSDILVIPEAMGMQIDWTEQGPRFPHPLCESSHPSALLHPDADRLGHVFLTIDRVVEQNTVPLIGFCGAPLTTLCFMLQGTSTRQAFPLAKKFFYENREETRRLIDAVTDFSIDYALRQIAHGIDTFQLFDTYAHIVPTDVYAELFLPAVRRITDAVRSRGIPLIFFPKGLGSGLRLITPDVCDFVGIDWQTTLDEARRLVHPEVGLQGNLDPHLLFAPRTEIARTMERHKAFFAEHQHWIVNLGHGVLADTPVEKLRFLTDWVKTANWTDNGRTKDPTQR